MKARMLILAAGGVVAMICAGESQAQLFGGNCVTVLGSCSSELTTALQYARQALQLEREVITAEQEIANTIALPGQVYQGAEGMIQQVVSIAQRADLLLGNTGRFIGNLNASAYPLPANAMDQIVAHQNAIGNAIEQLGRVIGVVNPQLAPRATLLSAIQSQSFTAQGRLQALQSANQLAATTGQDMHSLVTLTTAMAQSQQAATLAEHDRKAMEDAKMNDFSTNYQSYVTTGWKGF
jgi:P-type conjugative transfer protein TrbJ